MISFIVPAFNEGKDIEGTLQALLEVRFPEKEIIVVDDASTDETPSILAGFARRDSGIRVLRHSTNQGAAAARNTAVRASRGDILVFVDADVRIPSDFAERILRHYEGGADMLIGESEVINQESLYGRFAQAQHHFMYDGREDLVWDQGISCRRSAALDVGLFPESVTGYGGEDVAFGQALAGKYRKVMDRSIVVPHVAPGTLREFWSQRVSRGRGVAFTHHALAKRPLWRLAIRFLLKMLVSTIAELARFPLFFRHYLGRAQKAHRGWIDAAPFLFAAMVQAAAHRWGEWSGWFRLVRSRSGASNQSR